MFVRHFQNAIFLGFVSVLLSGQAFAQVCSSPLTPTTRGTVKFYYGHYVAVSAGAYNLSDTLKDITPIPQIKGVQRRYSWADVQKGANSFSWTDIDNDIESVAKAGKKLSIVLMWKYKAKGGISPVPSYIDALTSKPHHYPLGGSGTGSSAVGWLAAMDNPVVVTEFVKFLKKVAERYDRNNTVANIVFNETALSVTKSGFEAALRRTVTTTEMDTISNRIIDGIIKINQQASCAFKATPVIQLANFPFKKLPDLTESMLHWASGMGGPDVWYNDSEVEGPGRAYTFYPGLATKVPIGVIIAGGNYLYENHTPETLKEELRDAYTFRRTRDWSAERVVDELGTKAVNQLKANYVFWRRESADADSYLAFLRQVQLLRTASETFPPTKTECPTVYAGRCTKGNLK